MKKLLILSCFALLWNCNSTNNKKNYLEENNFSGNVKSVKESYYKAIEKFGEIEKVINKDENHLLHYKTFDKSGNLIEDIMYDSKGNIAWHSIHKYNNKGNLVEIEWYESDGTPGTKRVYLYNNSILLEEIFFKKNQVFDNKITYSHNKKGEIIEKNQYNTDGSLRYKNKMIYDKKSNIIEENEYDSIGNLSKKWFKKYNKNGYIIEDRIFYPEYKNESISTYSYDLNDNLTELNFLDSNNEIIQKFTYKYDSKRNVIEENEYDSVETLKNSVNYLYEYDNKGNWIKRIKYENNELINIYEREIDYF